MARGLDAWPALPEALKGGILAIDAAAGGESGKNARPLHPDSPRQLRDQCAAAGVPFFMKQMSKKAPIPEDLFIRELPNVAREA